MGKSPVPPPEGGQGPIWKAWVQGGTLPPLPSLCDLVARGGSDGLARWGYLGYQLGHPGATEKAKGAKLSQARVSSLITAHSSVHAQGHLQGWPGAAQRL